MRAVTVMTAAWLVAGTASAQTAPAVKKVPFGGEEVAVTATIPPEMPGTYRYEKKGEPLVTLNADGTGSFQPHQRPAIPLHYWLLADDAGVAKKQLGQGNPNYGYTIIVQYGPGGDGNYPAGGYDGMSWAMDVAGGCAIILGERFKC